MNNFLFGQSGHPSEPKHREPHPETSRQADHPNLASGPVKHGEPVLLLVEDSDDDAELILRAIRRSSPDVNTIREDVIPTGIERFDELVSQGRTPFLVIVDGRVAGSDAAELLSHVRTSASPSTPIVVMSGAVEDRVAARYSDLGADDVLRKPVDYSDFLNLVSETIATYKARLRDS